MWKNRGFSAINIFGLAAGMACTLLIFLFVKDETSYDRYHKDAGNIHRVVKDFVNEDGTRLPDATTPPALAPALQRELPEVANVTRVFPGWGGSFLMQYGDKKYPRKNYTVLTVVFLMYLHFHLYKGMQKRFSRK